MPGLVSRLTDVGLEIMVEPGAGQAAGLPDDDYRDAGAAVDGGTLDGAAAVLSVQPLAAHQVGVLASGSITISFLPTAQELDLVRALRDAGRSAFAMELVPRTPARRQAMDALSSQDFVAGYRTVSVAVEPLPRFMPLSMTASGTIRPVKVLGAGVAGLQAIAMSRRIGAMVRAYDVRGRCRRGAQPGRRIRRAGAADPGGHGRLRP